MVDFDRNAVEQAIIVLVSERESDDAWLDAARIVLDATVHMVSAPGSDQLTYTGSGRVPVLALSAVFGVYALVPDDASESVAIVSLSGLLNDRRQTEYRVYYDGPTFEPLVFVSATLELDTNSSWLRSFIYQLNRLIIWGCRTLLRRSWNEYWVTTRAVVVYSAAPEYEPGKELPLG